MLFQITEHLFDPHSTPVKLQGHTQIRQIGSQTPGFFLTDLPMHQQVDRVNLLGRQTATSQPDALTGFVDVTTECLPAALLIEPNTCIGFLAQDIEPMPSIQLAQDCHRAKFAVSDQKNSCSCGDQLAHIGQQSQMLSGSTVSFDVLDPGPGNRDGPFPIGQTDNQQLMSKANLGAIYDQTDFSQMPELSFQPLPSDGFVPFPYSDSRIVQQPAQSPGGTQQFGWSGFLPCNSAQTNRPALINTDDQPDKIADLGNPLTGSQFPNSANSKYHRVG